MAEWIEHMIEEGGYLALAFVMFLENVFPPIPSEVVMPLAGYHAQAGTMSLWGAIAAGSAGAFLGALFWYWVGRLIGPRRMRSFIGRHGRWLAMTCSDFDAARRWFDKYGGPAVFLGRLAPTVRTLISVPAGIVRMPFGVFAIYTVIGATIWTAALAWAGYLLGSQRGVIDAWLNPVANIALGIGLVIYVWRVVTIRPEDDCEPEETDAKDMRRS
jgi:membrane protein DedA with SNARE-associated domain